MASEIAIGLHNSRLEPAPVKLSPEDRAARGKAARKAVPRDSHDAFRPAAGRPDPVGLLEKQAQGRVADLLPIRYGRMLASPFAFFRGAALLMACDLSGTPVTGLTVQTCGDAHLSNFGIFASPERSLVFDINDFDETLPGPWEWDVKRLAASVEVAGRGSGFGDRAAARDRARRRGTLYARRCAPWLASARSTPGSRPPMSRTWHSVTGVLDRHERRGLRGADRPWPGTGPGTVPRQAGPHGRRPAPVRRGPAVAGAGLGLLPGAQPRPGCRTTERIVTNYRRTLEWDRRSSSASTSRGPGAEGGRVRQRGHARWVVCCSIGRGPRTAVSPGQGSGPRFWAVRRPQPVPEPGRACGRGPAADAGGRGFFLGWHRFPGRAGPRLLRPPVAATGSFRRRRGMDPPVMRAYAQLCGRSLARAHARSGDRIAIGPTSAVAFDRAVAPSPPATPTRTSATTTAWPPRSSPAR